MVRTTEAALTGRSGSRVPAATRRLSWKAGRPVKWDIDRALRDMEPESCPGTTLKRIYIPIEAMPRDGVKIRPEDTKKGGANVWCLSLGHSPQGG